MLGSLVARDRSGVAGWFRQAVRPPLQRGSTQEAGLLTRCLHLGKGQLVDVEGRLQTRQWDDEGGLRHWKTEVVVGSLEMLSGRGKKEYAREAQEVATDPGAPSDGALAAQAVSADQPQEAVVAM